MNLFLELNKLVLTQSDMFLRDSTRVNYSLVFELLKTSELDFKDWAIRLWIWTYMRKIVSIFSRIVWVIWDLSKKKLNTLLLNKVAKFELPTRNLSLLNWLVKSDEGVYLNHQTITYLKWIHLPKSDTPSISCWWVYFKKLRNLNSWS